MTDAYTDAEICELYRDGKDDPCIIRKISQLALKPEDEIITILHNAGKALHIKYDPNRCKPHRVSKITDDVWRAAINAKLKGTDPEQICVAYHISHNYLQSNWRKKAKELGIPLLDHRISSGVQCIPDKIRKDTDEMEEKKTEILSEETEKETACDIAIDVLYLLKRHNTENFKIESFDGDINVNASIPAKEDAV